MVPSPVRFGLVPGVPKGAVFVRSVILCQTAGERWGEPSCSRPVQPERAAASGSSKTTKVARLAARSNLERGCPAVRQEDGLTLQGEADHTAFAVQSQAQRTITYEYIY
jgi:hypothetical protein